MIAPLLIGITLAAAPPAAWPDSALDAHGSKRSDAIRTGIKTDEMLDADPYGFRVTWIEWDSAFRGTGLQPGDRIIGVNGVRYDRTGRTSATAANAVGQWNEPRAWEKAGARHGEPVNFTVLRRDKTLQVQGKLRADRFYYTPTKKKALGPGGPERLKSDGFSGAWAGWFEKATRSWSLVLDGGWRRRINTRQELAKQREDAKRIEFLAREFPGPFATTTQQDWQRVVDELLGPERAISPEALEYRELGEKRAAELEKLGLAARDRFIEALRDETIEPFPAVDPIDGDPSRALGKVVVLSVRGPRDWISEAGHGYLAWSEGRRGHYFVDTRSAEFGAVLDAAYEYRRLVTPKLRETYAIVGRIDAPTLRVSGRSAKTGWMVKVLGAMVGGRTFVDATVPREEVTFVGAETLRDPSRPPPPATASPQEVVEAAIAALKLGDEPAWRALYARWSVSVYKSRASEPTLYYNPYRNLRNLGSSWERGRRLILDKVYDARVFTVDPERRLTTGQEFDGAPIVDEVIVEVETIGKFEEGYRPFVDVNVRRLWTLQRVDGGPWRITGDRAL